MSNDNYYYHMWLGIAPEEMPTNAYRLFGLQLFESDTIAIQNAAQQRITYVQSFLGSEHGEAAQRVTDALNHAASAILDPNAKSLYDQQLSQYLATQQPVASQQIVDAPQAPDAQQLAGQSPVVRQESTDTLAALNADVPHLAAPNVELPNSASVDSAAQQDPLEVQSTGTASPMPQHVPASHQAPAMQQMMTPQMATTAQVDGQSRRKPNGKQRNPVFEVAKIVVGGIAGIALGFVGVAAMKPSFDVFGWFHDRQVIEAAQLQNQPVIKRSAPPRPATSRPSPISHKQQATTAQPPSDVRAPNEQQPDFDSKNQVIATPSPSTALPTTVSTDDIANEPENQSSLPTTVEVPPEERPTEPQFQFPKSVSLPSLLNKQSKVLARLPESVSEGIEIELINDAAKTVQGASLALLAASDNSLRWQARLVSSNPQSRVQFIPLAELAVADRDLAFHWLEQAVDHASFAQQLLNCALRITSDEETHIVALREAITKDGQTLSLAKKTNLHEIQLQHLPQTDTVYIELDQLDRFPVSAIVKKDSIGKVGQEITIGLPETPGAELRLRLIRQTGGGLALVLSPIYKTAGVEFDLSVDRVEGIKDGSKKALEKAMKALPRKQAEYSVAQSQLQSAISSPAGTATQQTIKAQQVASFTRRVRSLNKQLLTLQKTITEMQQRLAALPNAEALVDRLHNRAVLRFRLFSVAGGHEIELVRAGLE